MCTTEEKLGSHFGRKVSGEVIVSFQCTLYFKILQCAGGEGKAIQSTGYISESRDQIQSR